MYNVALLTLNKASEISSILQAPYHFRTNYFHNNLCQTHTHTHTSPTAILLISATFSLFPLISTLIFYNIEEQHTSEGAVTRSSRVRADKAR